VRSADNLVHDLITVANDLRRHIDDALAERGYEHRRPGFAPLLSLVWQGGVPQGRLAAALGVSPQAASQTVGLAADAGFVTRIPNPEDGRSKLVVLTELGRAFVADGAAAITARAADYAEVLGARRFARFDNTLARLRRGMGLSASDDPVATLTPGTSIMAVSVLAAEAMHSLHVAMRSAGHTRITAGQNLVLVHIGPDGARSSDLARVQRVSRQAVSAVLHDLESLRYVRRRDDSNDGRGVVFMPTRRGRAVLDDYVAGIDAVEQRYSAVLGSPRVDEMARSARDLSRMLGLEHVFALASSGNAIGPAPTERRQLELGDLGQEVLRWLGEADAWWLAGFLRQQVIDGIEHAPSGLVEESG
jgi:DNA-binding MarR family transcriptional regulator